MDLFDIYRVKHNCIEYVDKSYIPSCLVALGFERLLKTVNKSESLIIRKESLRVPSQTESSPLSG